MKEQEIRIIESIKCGLEPRAMMVLVLLGLKPATRVELFTHNEAIESVAEKILRAGLAIGLIREPRFCHGKRTGIFSVAGTQPVAIGMARAFRNASQNHEAIGTYLGYPRTAIEAYVGKRKRLENQDSFLYGRGVPTLLDFVMSQEHHPEEVKVLDRWWSAIQQYAPNLARQMGSLVGAWAL